MRTPPTRTLVARSAGRRASSRTLSLHTWHAARRRRRPFARASRRRASSSDCRRAAVAGLSIGRSTRAAPQSSESQLARAVERCDGEHFCAARSFLNTRSLRESWLATLYRMYAFDRYPNQTLGRFHISMRLKRRQIRRLVSIVALTSALLPSVCALNCKACEQEVENERHERVCVRRPNCCNGKEASGQTIFKTVCVDAADDGDRLTCLVSPCANFRRACKRARHCVAADCRTTGCSAFYYDSLHAPLAAGDCDAKTLKRQQKRPPTVAATTTTSVAPRVVTRKQQADEKPQRATLNMAALPIYHEPTKSGEYAAYSLPVDRVKDAKKSKKK